MWRRWREHAQDLSDACAWAAMAAIAASLVATALLLVVFGPYLSASDLAHAGPEVVQPGRP